VEWQRRKTSTRVHTRAQARRYVCEKHLLAINGILDMRVHVNRGAAVEVAAELKGLNHRLAARHMRHDPQLKLSVIHDDKLVPFLG
jgi:hypothetical protein